jgi:cell division protein ZapA
MAAPVEVEIYGQKFSVTSDDSEKHVRQIAAHVDEKMRQIGSRDSSVPMYTRAVLAALNIASEWQKLRESQDEVERVVGRLTDLLGAETADH